MSHCIPRAIFRAAIAALLVTPAVLGQNGMVANSAPPSEASEGFHLYSVSIYSGYLTNAYSLPGFNLINSLYAPVTLGPDEIYGAQISVGWQRYRLRTRISVLYSGGYSGMVQHSSLGGVNQFLSVNLTRRLTRRWTLTVLGSASQQTIMQYLFEPESVGGVAQAPVATADFATASRGALFGTTPIASPQPSAPVLVSPVQSSAVQSLLLGARFVAYSTDAQLTYAFSPRSEFHVSTFSAAGQNYVGGNAGAGTVLNAANSVLPFSIGGDTGAGFSYMATPHTTVGGDASAYLVWNRFEHAGGAMAKASVAHRISRHWSVGAYGGGSAIRVAQSVVSQPSMDLLIGGGSIGWQRRTQLLAATYDRSSYDSFGFLAGRVNSETGSWAWHRPDSIWSASVSLGELQMNDPGFASITGWRGVAQIAVQLKNRETVLFEYARLRSSGSYAGVFNQFQVDSIRMSLAWGPARSSH
jgi:hypothetical protein